MIKACRFSRYQVNVWTNAGMLLIGPLETNFGEIVIEVNAFTIKKMHF